MIIRKAEIKDVNGILSMLNGVPNFRTSQEDNNYDFDYVLCCIGNKEFDLILVAEEKDKLIGFLMAELWKGKKYSFLTNLFVKSNYRRRGVANILIKEYEKICRKHKMDEICLLVQKENIEMQGFLNKLSFNKGKNFHYYKKKLK